MLNQAIKFNSILFLFAALLFTSCAKDDILSENFTAGKTEIDGKGGDKDGDMRGGRCFSLIFPVTIDFPDGTSTEVADKDAFKAAILEWKENNPDATDRPSLAYPVDVKMKEDGTIVTVNSQEEMAALKEDCRGEHVGDGHHGERCFSLIFPVTIDFPDGTSTEVADKDAFKTAILEWKENNPDAEERPRLAYPIDVELEDETTVTVNSAEEMAALKEDCRGEHVGDGHHGERCFTLVFPITLTLPDGTTATGEDKATLRDLIKDWYENNPDVEEKPSLVFPVDVTLSEDDSVVTVNSQEELAALKEDCED